MTLIVIFTIINNFNLVHFQCYISIWNFSQTHRDNLNAGSSCNEETGVDQSCINKNLHSTSKWQSCHQDRYQNHQDKSSENKEGEGDFHISNY
jgi:hypothetical protein